MSKRPTILAVLNTVKGDGLLKSSSEHNANNSDWNLMLNQRWLTRAWPSIDTENDNLIQNLFHFPATDLTARTLPPWDE